MSDKPGPSPKKRKTAPKSPKSPQSKASPKKFSPRKYFGQRRYSPKKKSPAKRKLLPPDEGTSLLAGERAGEAERVSGEAYYSANFKEVLSKCLLPSNPEHHVISDEEVALVEEFMALDGGWVCGYAVM